MPRLVGRVENTRNQTARSGRQENTRPWRPPSLPVRRVAPPGRENATPRPSSGPAPTTTLPGVRPRSAATGGLSGSDNP